MKPELFSSFKKGYNGRALTADMLSGLLVAIIALPLSIALGIQSNATLQAGLITAIVAGFFISALGGSRFQIGGPTAAFVVIVYAYIADPEIGFLGLQLATIGAGILLLILGFCRAGGLIRYVPYPIVVGFTTGIGITLAAGQLKDFLGLTYSGSASEFIHKISLYIANIRTVNFYAVGIGILTLLVIILLPKVWKKAPAAFLAIIVATLAAVVLKAGFGEAVVIPTIGSQYGDVEATFDFIDFSAIGSIKFGKLVVPVFVIAFLSAIESLLSATVADGMAGTSHNPNQELVGQGVANIASPLFGGLPATGAIARTAANINAGARSPLSGVFHAIFLLVMYVALMPVVKFIPMSALAAVLLSVALRMCKFRAFFSLMRVRVFDSIVLVASCLLTVFFDLTYGVLGGLALALIFALVYCRRHMRLSVVGAIEGVGGEFGQEKREGPDFEEEFAVNATCVGATCEEDIAFDQSCVGADCEGKIDANGTRVGATCEEDIALNQSCVGADCEGEIGADCSQPRLDCAVSDEPGILAVVAAASPCPTIGISGAVQFFNVDRLLAAVEKLFAESDCCAMDFAETAALDLSAMQRIFAKTAKYKSIGKELRILNFPARQAKSFERLTKRPKGE